MRGAAAVLRGVDVAVDWLTQGLAALLVLAEIAILFIGVVGRYGFDHPFVWVEEVASSLFLWLVSLGAVIALSRGEHMRMTILVGKMTPAMRRIAARCAALLVVAVALGLILPGITYAMQQQAILTPVLQLPGSVEVYGQLAALVLLLYVALRQLMTGGNWVELALVLAGGAVLVLALWLLEHSMRWATPIW
jgi:TRAP-type C4-dicarboxylate transport system permease small subunit